MVPGCMSPLAGRWLVTAAQKKQRPLIRYAGSAAETSIGSKPIGSELSTTICVVSGIVNTFLRTYGYIHVYACIC